MSCLACIKSCNTVLCCGVYTSIGDSLTSIHYVQSHTVVSTQGSCVVTDSNAIPREFHEAVCLSEECGQLICADLDVSESTNAGHLDCNAVAWYQQRGTSMLSTALTHLSYMTEVLNDQEALSSCCDDACCDAVG